MAHILNPLLSIKVLLKAACSQSEGLYATFRGTFIDKRGFRIWANVLILLYNQSRNKGPVLFSYTAALVQLVKVKESMFVSF